MRCGAVCRVALCLGLGLPSTGLRAGEWEIGGAIAFGQEAKGNLAANGNFPTVPYTIVQNSHSGAWNMGSVQVGYEALQLGAWGFWLRADYSGSLAQPKIYHSGENFGTGGSSSTEVFNGTASHTSRSFGLGLTRKFSFGEIGVSIGPRSHEMSTEGNRQNRNNGVFTYDSYSVHHTYKDTFATLSFALSQKQNGFSSFQKLTYGTGFGSSVPTVNPGPADWRMSEAYLAQFRPNQEFQITLGIRL